MRRLVESDYAARCSGCDWQRHLLECRQCDHVCRDHEARIINISLAGPTPSSRLQSAVNYAWNNGAVIFAAAGNRAFSSPVYPAACDNVVAVSATEPGDTLAVSPITAAG